MANPCLLRYVFLYPGILITKRLYWGCLDWVPVLPVRTAPALRLRRGDDVLAPSIGRHHALNRRVVSRGVVQQVSVFPTQLLALEPRIRSSFSDMEFVALSFGNCTENSHPWRSMFLFTAGGAAS